MGTLRLTKSVEVYVLVSKCVPVCAPAHYFGPAPVGDMSASCYLYLQFTVFSTVPSEGLMINRI